MCSQADPRTVAGKIASEINRGDCRVCHRPINGGVYAFGTSGSDARWYETLETAQAANRGRARILFPLPADGGEITPDEALEWLEARRDEIESLIEDVYARKLARRVEREQREQNSGFRADQWPCDDCGFAKHRPADECERCGDNPVPLGIAAEDYNRARGYTH